MAVINFSHGLLKPPSKFPSDPCSICYWSATAVTAFVTASVTVTST